MCNSTGRGGSHARQAGKKRKRCVCREGHDLQRQEQTIGNVKPMNETRLGDSDAHECALGVKNLGGGGLIRRAQPINSYQSVKVVSGQDSSTKRTRALGRVGSSLWIEEKLDWAKGRGEGLLVSYLAGFQGEGYVKSCLGISSIADLKKSTKKSRLGGREERGTNDGRIAGHGLARNLGVGERKGDKLSMGRLPE